MTKVTTDPIADMLTRIRNAIAVSKREVTMPHSKAKESIARLLQQHGYLDTVSVEDLSIGKSLHISINAMNSNARINEITRLSKPGRRHYVRANAIPTVMQGRGIVIVSTSRGMMVGDDARKQGVGGELICKVY